MGGGRDILVRPSIEHHAVPVPGLTHLKVTVIALKSAGRPAKILAAYFSPSRPLIKSDLTACFSGGLPVLMEGGLSAKNVDWNSRLTTVRGKLLRDYINRYSCLIYEHDTPTTVPYNSSATPDVSDIVVTKRPSDPAIYDCVISFSSDHLPVLIDT